MCPARRRSARAGSEVLRGVLNRYFEEIRGIIERHGGTVEKFIGDAVMAVFGIPRVHEDDALRAVRAAAEIRDRLPVVAEEVGVALRFRTGVNTGPVLMGEGENLAIGDAVNVAARLEQAAEPGEIVIGDETLRLVRDAVEVETLEPLELKGKSERVAAYRLVSVSGQLERRFATPMVGRDRELRRLHDTFGQAVHDRSCQLFTVLGSAGVGKSRLAAEFLAGLDAQVVRGRCLSYGEGITYWPVVEVLKQLDALPVGDAVRPLRSLLGETDEPAVADEIAWGFRKLLEQEAQERPLVCVFDDVHWGEETLLDLVEHVADLSRDAPILLLCMARAELLERRPSWGGGKWNATTVLLEPLDAAETERLVSELGGVSDELKERIVRVAEGNPLFLEEMLALVRDSGGEAVVVPPTIQALLAARLDQLEPAERAVLERGSVEGRTFHRGAVAALADGDGQVDQRLVSLVRKQLVRPDRPQFPEEDAYRFRHLLIRDAAYDALPKAVRADLHGRFAAWLEQHGSELVELDEILGYHLEQAARYREELGRRTPRSPKPPASGSPPPDGTPLHAKTSVRQRRWSSARSRSPGRFGSTSTSSSTSSMRCSGLTRHVGSRSPRRPHAGLTLWAMRSVRRLRALSRRRCECIGASARRTSWSGARGRRCRCSKPREMTPDSSTCGVRSAMASQTWAAVSRNGPRLRSGRFCTPGALAGRSSTSLALPLHLRWGRGRQVRRCRRSTRCSRSSRAPRTSCRERCCWQCSAKSRRPGKSPSPPTSGCGNSESTLRASGWRRSPSFVAITRRQRPISEAAVMHSKRAATRPCYRASRRGSAASSAHSAATTKRSRSHCADAS